MIPYLLLLPPPLRHRLRNLRRRRHHQRIHRRHPRRLLLRRLRRCCLRHRYERRNIRSSLARPSEKLPELHLIDERGAVECRTNLVDPFGAKAIACKRRIRLSSSGKRPAIHSPFKSKVFNDGMFVTVRLISTPPSVCMSLYAKCNA